jgi:hypothetical protein
VADVKAHEVCPSSHTPRYAGVKNSHTMRSSLFSHAMLRTKPLDAATCPSDACRGLPATTPSATLFAAYCTRCTRNHLAQLLNSCVCSTHPCTSPPGLFHSRPEPHTGMPAKQQITPGWVDHLLVGPPRAECCMTYTLCSVVGHAYHATPWATAGHHWCPSHK